MLRFGIIGTNVISDAFVGACQATDGRARAVGVHSRRQATADAFAARHGLDTATDDLDALFEAVDAVYIASPVGAHHAQALAAIAAGRHVLVEKTMGADAGQVVAIVEAAEDAGVIALEAVRNVHTPMHRLIRDTLPELGELRYARLEKLQYSSRYDAFRGGEVLNAFDPSLGNSALADIGVYCLQPALDLFGAPRNVGGASVFLANGFEAGGSIYLDHGSLVVDLAWSKIAAGLGPSVITGEDGSLSLDDPADVTRIVLHPRKGEPQVLWEGPPGPPMATMHYEINDFCHLVDAGAMDQRWSALSVNARAIMDAHLAASAAAWCSSPTSPPSTPTTKPPYSKPSTPSSPRPNSEHSPAEPAEVKPFERP